MQQKQIYIQACCFILFRLYLVFITITFSTSWLDLIHTIHVAFELKKWGSSDKGMAEPDYSCVIATIPTLQQPVFIRIQNLN